MGILRVFEWRTIVPLITAWVIALGLALVGWGVASRLRVPAAGVLGPMLLVGMASCLGIALPADSSWLKTGLQVIIGTFVGTSVNPRTISGIRSMGWPLAFVTAWNVGSALLIGYGLAFLGGFDLGTALLGTSPGGLPEMTAMAVTLHADTPTVAVLHSLRLGAILALIPLVLDRDRAARSPVPPGIAAGSGNPSSGVNLPPLGLRAVRAQVRDSLPWLATLGLGALGGALCLWAQVPAGAMTGAMVAVGLGGSLGVPMRRPPPLVRSLALVGIGTLVGVSFGPETVARLGDAALPLILATAATLGSGLAAACFVRRQLGIDFRTAFLACAPGGMSQVVMVADELGVDMMPVAIFQVARRVSVVLIMPFLFRFLI